MRRAANASRSRTGIELETTKAAPCGRARSVAPATAPSPSSPSEIGERASRAARSALAQDLKGSSDSSLLCVGHFELIRVRASTASARKYVLAVTPWSFHLGPSSITNCSASACWKSHLWREAEVGDAPTRTTTSGVKCSRTRASLKKRS